MNFEYPFKLTPAEEGGFLINFLDFPETYSEGDSEDECFYMAQDVLNLTLTCLLEDDAPIPAPSDADTKYKVAPSPQIQAAIAVRNAKDETRKNTADLARAMDTSWPVADKLTDPKHWPTLRQLDKAARALGKRLIVKFEDASY
ncbi:MAG: type II toxin-antitoxin system HicB family antitoxin [Candidatus Riflebacteria bacterium]|nr:type II toxin-antitoxin system HicB family antitoxin [Candidatus Riflebacteria bacterium]